MRMKEGRRLHFVGGWMLKSPGHQKYFLKNLHKESLAAPKCLSDINWSPSPAGLPRNNKKINVMPTEREQLLEDNLMQILCLT